MRRRKPNWKHSVVFLLIFSCMVLICHRQSQLSQGRQQLRKMLLFPESLQIVDEAIVRGEYVATYRAHTGAGRYWSEQVFRASNSTVGPRCW